MGKIFIERQLDDIAYAANSQKSIELPRNGVFRGLSFRLTGSVATGATAPIGQKSLTPYRLIRRIEVVANGKDTIKSIPFWFLRLLNRTDAGIIPDLTDVGVAVTTTYPFVAYGFLPFSFTRARRPIDGALDARRLSTLSLVITWGDLTDLYTTPGATAAFSVAPSIQVKTLEYTNVEDSFSAFVNKHSLIQHEVTSTKQEDQERLTVDRVYRRFFLYSEAADVAANNIINKVTLKSGTFVFKSVKGDMLRSELKSIYGIDTVDTGLYVLDNTTDGMLSEALNAKGLTSLELVLDVTKQAGTNLVYIIPEEVGD